MIAMAVKKSTSSRIIAPVIFVGLLAILAGCSRSEQEAQATPPPGGVLLTGAGATFPSVLYNRWFSVYHDSHPNILSSTLPSAAEKAFAASSERTFRKRKGSISVPATPPCPTPRSNVPTTML